MNFYQIITTYYADAWKLQQFTLGDANDGKGIFITSWNVPDVKQPTYDEIMALATPEFTFNYELNTFLVEYLAQLPSVLNVVARQRNYDDSISCVSYLNSTNPVWQLEAKTYNAWRDSVWDYLYVQQQLIATKARPIPSVDELNAELPVIDWPI